MQTNRKFKIQENVDRNQIKKWFDFDLNDPDLQCLGDEDFVSIVT